MPRTDPRDKSHFWRSTNLSGFSFLSANFTDHDYPSHSHNEMVIVVTEEGTSSFESLNVVEQANHSRIQVFNPAAPHLIAMRGSERWRYRAIYLTDEALRTIRDRLGLATSPYFASDLFDDATLADAFIRLHRCCEVKDCDKRWEELFYFAFGTLYERYGSGVDHKVNETQCSGLIRSVLDEMAGKCDENIRLADLAEGRGLSPYQLVRFFHRTLGISPYACLTQIRLDRACRLLRLGAPIVDTALTVGFCDQSALQKHFKRVYGITPKQYSRAFA